LQEALALVRRDLGESASILHTREVCGGALVRWIPGLRRIEVTASADVYVPSRLPPPAETALAEPAFRGRAASPPGRCNADLADQLRDLQSMVADLCASAKASGRPDIPPELFQLYTDLIESEVPDDLARKLVEQVRSQASTSELADPLLVKARVASMIESDVRVTGPLDVIPGRRRLVALVGPTGVGKTTTIAKLAAHYRLREKRKVGLITVDTYRIAAVEQLRTYADIIDLPMQVVSSPREMREAAARMADVELVLMDTAGRSPKDEVKIHELKNFLAEAQTDEVHLVLSAVGGAAGLERTAERFSVVGTTALILTKLDEAAGLGNLLPLLQRCKLPLSYLTTGQNVPDDIEAADPRRLVGLVLGLAATAAGGGARL
jgi:flagellar biosynthesis protein FlhF